MYTYSIYTAGRELAIKQLPAAISRPSVCPPVSLFQLISSKSLIFFFGCPALTIYFFLYYICPSLFWSSSPNNGQRFYISNIKSSVCWTTQAAAAAELLFVLLCSLYPQKVCFFFLIF
jgi:hypothetical protein